MSDTKTGRPASAEMVGRMVESSPFARHLGLRLEELEGDRAVLVLPFREEVVTVGTVVHGGALASLLDTTAVAAAWSSDEFPANARGTTVAMSIQYLSAAQSTDVRAEARVTRRGRSLVFLDVDATDSAGNLVAKAQVTYKLG